MYLGLLRGNLSLKQLTFWSISLTYKEISNTPFHWHDVKKGYKTRFVIFNSQILLKNKNEFT